MTKVELRYKNNEGDISRSKAAAETHLVLGLHVGAGIDEQPRALQVTIPSGTMQHRESVLR